jgi:hypothetical protein
LTTDIKIFENNRIADYVENLGFSDYEAISSLLVKRLLGNITLGQNYGSRDEGIDFYGYYSPTSSIYSKFLNSHSWYIGQVKCYQSNIKTNALRELLGTIVLAKNGIWALDGRYDGKLEVKNYDHVIPMFITKSYYSYDSINLAKQYNIKLFDNLDLIFWLIIFYKDNIDILKEDLKKIQNNLNDLANLAD